MKDRTRQIYAVLLAAGESSRLTPYKLFLPWKESTVLEAALDNLLAAQLSGMVVVVGKDGRRAEDLISGRSCRVVFNPNFRDGMGSSLSRGADFWREMGKISPFDGILVALADQPLISPRIINRVISSYQATTRGLVVPVFQGRRGHPVILAGKYLPELIGLNADIGARVILRDHPEDILEVEVDSEAILRDIDSRRDYAELLPRGRGRGG